MFQGRYKSIILEGDAYLLELTRYIHLNPVRAKIVDSPERYSWSSYSEYIKKGKEGLINKIQADRYFKLAPQEYNRFVVEGIETPDTLFAQVYAGFILGREKFIKSTLNILKDRVKSTDFAYKKNIHSLVPEEIIGKVADYYKKEPEELCRARKKPLLAKKIAVFLLKKLTALTNKQIGERFGIGYSGVSWVVQNVERLMEENKGVRREVESLVSHLKG